MTIPNPAALKARLDAKKSSTSKDSQKVFVSTVPRKDTKIDEISTSRNLSTSKPRKKASSKNTQGTESTSESSNHTNPESLFQWEDGSPVPLSSPQGLDFLGAKLSSKTSRLKRSTSSQEDKATTSGEVSETTENSQPKASRNSAPSKKDFVLPEHLTQRPLLNHEGLQALKNQMNAPSRRAGYKELEGRGRTPVRPRRSGKNAVMKNKKENN